MILLLWRRQLVRLVLGFLVGKKANDGVNSVKGELASFSEVASLFALFPTKDAGPGLRTRSRDEKMILY